MANTMPLKDNAYLLEKYLPHEAIDRIYNFLCHYRVTLRISRARTSKLGDYRAPREGAGHTISVNVNLNAYFFLAVLLHEMAHLLTYEQYKREVNPHGIEWQRHYADLLAQYRDCFPAEILPCLDDYIARLPLSPSKGRQFDHALDHYGKPNEEEQQETHLNDLQAGDCFLLQGKQFKAIEKKRSRWCCVEIGTNRVYTVRGEAPVKKIAPNS